MINMRIRVRNLVRKHGTRNPETIAKELGITIQKKPFTKVMGFFKKELGNKFIVVNSNLSEDMQRLVIAHELGHALLHNSKLTNYIHEYTLTPRGRVEIEANRFAAELLINEADVDKHSIENMSLDQLSYYFGVPKELVQYKFCKKIYINQLK
jgi:Zn-dependent peptidase ImmA (M78 family)